MRTTGVALQSLVVLLFGLAAYCSQYDSRYYEYNVATSGKSAYHGRYDRYRYKPKKIHLGVCPARMPQNRYTKVKVPGYIPSNPYLPSKTFIHLEMSTRPNFVRNTDVDVFLDIFERENGFSRYKTLAFLKGDIKWHKDCWGIDFTTFHPEDILKKGGITIPDGKATLITTTFSIASEGELAGFKYISETSNKFCRTHRRHPVSASGAYVFINEDFTSASGIEFKKGEQLQYLNVFLPECGIILLLRMTHRLSPSKDPKKADTYLVSSEYDVITNHRSLGKGNMKILRNVNPDKSQTGLAMAEWDDPLHLFSYGYYKK